MHTALLGLLAFCLGADAAPVAFEFQDTAVYEGRPMVHYRPIEFRNEPAQPLAGEYSPTPGALYGQLPVGPKSETAISIVWLPKADGGPILWLDANADGRLAADERHVASGKECEIRASIRVQTQPKAKSVERMLLFRRPTFGPGLRYAVRGYATGRLNLGGEEHSVLLADGNADGCLDSVGKDRVWIDLNRDGRFEGLTEQFPLGKPLTKAGQVYVIRSDPLAATVTANLRLPGEGKLRLTLPAGRKAAKFSAELISDLGELVAVEKLDEPVPVPHGQYRVSWLKFQLTADDGQAWHYSFSRNQQRYFSVPLGQEVTIPLLEKVVMHVACELKQGKARPSETVTARLDVLADDAGLSLASCTRGGEDREQAAESSAEILLLSADGKTISRGMSGFS